MVNEYHSTKWFMKQNNQDFKQPIIITLLNHNDITKKIMVAMIEGDKTHEKTQ